MFNPPKKVCKDCQKNPPHPGRKICISCITRISKEKAKIYKQNTVKKERKKKDKVISKKRFSRSALTKEADRVFSLYIRERDKWLPCITCEAPYEENFQCGHFMSRRHLNTRWVKTNAHGQCPKCNLWGSGEQFAHAEGIDKLYGLNSARSIRKLAENTEKTTDQEILDYIRNYYELLTDMGIEYTAKKYYLHDN